MIKTKLKLTKIEPTEPNSILAEITNQAFFKNDIEWLTIPRWMLYIHDAIDDKELLMKPIHK